MEQIMIFGYVQYVTSVCIYKRHGNYKSYPAPGFIVHLLMKNSFKHSNILQPPCSSEGLSLKYLSEIGPTSFILESLLPHFGFSAPPPLRLRTPTVPQRTMVKQTSIITMLPY